EDRLHPGHGIGLGKGDLNGRQRLGPGAVGRVTARGGGDIDDVLCRGEAGGAAKRAGGAEQLEETTTIGRSAHGCEAPVLSDAGSHLDSRHGEHTGSCPAANPDFASDAAFLLSRSGDAPPVLHWAMLSPTIRTRIRTAQLLTAVLASGVVVMTVVMTLVVQQGATSVTGGTGGTGAGNGIGSPPGGSAHGPMLIMLAVFSVTLLPMAYLVVPMIRMKTARVVWGDAPAEVDAPE